MRDKDIRTLGIILAVPMMIFATYNNLWAEPDRPKIEPVVVLETGDPVYRDPVYTELEDELEIQEITKNEGEEMGEMKQGELELLAACVEAEAGNQSLLGKRLVVDVILNRSEDPDFPNSVTEVIKQDGQFAVVQSGSIQVVNPSEDTWNAVYAELTGLRANENVLWFRTERYSKYGEPLACVGDHYFSGKGGQI